MADYIITGYDQAQAILRRPDMRQALYDAGAILMKDVLVNLHGNAHRVRRGAEAKVFRRDFFQYYEKEVFPVTLTETMKPHLERGRTDVCGFGYSVMLNLTADFTGLDRPDRTEEETTTLLQILRTLGKAPTLGQTLDKDKAAIRQEIADALALFSERFYRPSRDRRLQLMSAVESGNASEDDLPRDVLTMVLANEQTASEPDDVIMKEMAFYLLAGAFTSIHSTAHAVHRIFEWFDKHPDQADRLKADMSFLQRAAFETSRLHPSSPVTRRRPLEPVDLEGVGHLQPEDTVTVDLLSTNKDTGRFGANAADFDPYRDTGSQPLYGLSFGTGIHACIGRQLALGVLPKPGAEKDEDNQYGTIPLVLHALFAANARRDPDNPPEMDQISGRPNWGKYPILLG